MAAAGVPRAGHALFLPQDGTVVEMTNRPADEGDRASEPRAPAGGAGPASPSAPPVALDFPAPLPALPAPPSASERSGPPPGDASTSPPLATPAPEPPLAQFVPSMALSSADPGAETEDRIRRLEQALRKLEELQRQPARAPESGILPTEGAPPVRGPSLLGRAVAWVGSLGPLARDAVLGAPAGDQGLTRPSRPWFLLDAAADARAIVRMYTDPRYTLTWMGRLLPPALLLAFLTVNLWLPLLLPCVGWLLLKVPGLGWVLEKALELIIGFFLFRALGQEARRYRETAPDLPPSLRL